MRCNQIKDINTFVPVDNNKVFFLDTNVLYWYAYPRYGTTHQGTKYQAQPYYDFVDKLVASGNPLYTSVYNISELLNVIEKNEYDIFNTANPELHYSKKDFRKNASERGKVKKILSTTLDNVKNICSIVEHDFQQECLDEFVEKYEEHRCDPFDYIILSNCQKESKVNIISDDGDFSTITKINLFTANEIILNEARK